MKLPVITFFLVLAAFMVAVPVEGKRLPPDPVEPVAHEGLLYRAPHEEMGVVVAEDTSTGEVVWKKKIYKAGYYPLLEKDVRNVYITRLVIQKGDLIVVNEKRKVFRVDAETGKVLSEVTEKQKEKRREILDLIEIPPANVMMRWNYTPFIYDTRLYVDHEERLAKIEVGIDISNDKERMAAFYRQKGFHLSLLGEKDRSDSLFIAAGNLYKRIVENDTDNIEASIALAEIYSDFGLEDEGDALYRRLNEKYPRDSRLYASVMKYARDDTSLAFWKERGDRAFDALLKKNDISARVYKDYFHYCLASKLSEYQLSVRRKGQASVGDYLEKMTADRVLKAAVMYRREAPQDFFAAASLGTLYTGKAYLSVLRELSTSSEEGVTMLQSLARLRKEEKELIEKGKSNLRTAEELIDVTVPPLYYYQGMNLFFAGEAEQAEDLFFEYWKQTGDLEGLTAPLLLYRSTYADSRPALYEKKVKEIIKELEGYLENNFNPSVAYLTAKLNLDMERYAAAKEIFERITGEYDHVPAIMGSVLSDYYLAENNPADLADASEKLFTRARRPEFLFMMAAGHYLSWDENGAVRILRRIERIPSLQEKAEEMREFIEN